MHVKKVLEYFDGKFYTVSSARTLKDEHIPVREYDSDGNPFVHGATYLFIGEENSVAFICDTDPIKYKKFTLNNIWSFEDQID